MTQIPSLTQVSEDLQIGRDGARIVSPAANKLEGRDSTGAALIEFSVADGTVSTSAATFGQLSAAVSGQGAFWSIVRLSSDTDTALTGEQLVDGVMTNTNRVLLTNQTDPVENGIWRTDPGAWSRTADANDGSEFETNKTVSVQVGNTKSGYTYAYTGPSTPTVDTDPLVFELKTVNGSIPNGSITTAKLANEAVTTGKLAPAAVTPAKLATAAVTTGKLANEAVTPAKLAPEAVVTGKIAGMAVTTGKIANEAIVGSRIAPGAVATGKLATAAVTPAKLATAAVTTGKLATAGVTTSKIRNAAVTRAKLAPDAVDETKAAPGIVFTRFATFAFDTPSPVSFQNALPANTTVTRVMALPIGWDGGEVTIGTGGDQDGLMDAYEFGATDPSQEARIAFPFAEYGGNVVRAYINPGTATAGDARVMVECVRTEGTPPVMPATGDYNGTGMEGWLIFVQSLSASQRGYYSYDGFAVIARDAPDDVYDNAQFYGVLGDTGNWASWRNPLSDEYYVFSGASNNMNVLTRSLVAQIPAAAGGAADVGDDASLLDELVSAMNFGVEQRTVNGVKLMAGGALSMYGFEARWLQVAGDASLDDFLSQAQSWSYGFTVNEDMIEHGLAAALWSESNAEPLLGLYQWLSGPTLNAGMTIGNPGVKVKTSAGVTFLSPPAEGDIIVVSYDAGTDELTVYHNTTVVVAASLLYHPYLGATVTGAGTDFTFGLPTYLEPDITQSSGDPTYHPGRLRRMWVANGSTISPAQVADLVVADGDYNDPAVAAWYGVVTHSWQLTTSLDPDKGPLSFTTESL